MPIAQSQILTKPASTTPETERRTANPTTTPTSSRTKSLGRATEAHPAPAVPPGLEPLPSEDSERLGHELIIEPAVPTQRQLLRRKRGVPRHPRP